MILPSVARGARNIASGFLLICGALTQAKGQVAIDQDTQAAQVETAASNTVNKDPETGDAAIEQRGVASWYGPAWRGRRTASGTPFDDRAMTAAHLWLPFATLAQVTNVQTGHSVKVLVNDRGPYRAGRIIDLSAKAAEALGIKECGNAEVIVIAQY